MPVGHPRSGIVRRGMEVTALGSASRYLGTAAVAVVLMIGVGVRFAGQGVAPALVFVTLLGVVLARIDIEVRRLPFVLTVPALPITGGLLAISGVLDGWHPASRAVLSAVAWFGIYASIRALTRGRGMGRGDVMLAPTLGLVLGWLGWGHSCVGLGAGFVLAGVVAVSLIAGGRATPRSVIPFGPFMLAGAALGAFVGGRIAHTYLGG